MSEKFAYKVARPCPKLGRRKSSQSMALRARIAGSHERTRKHRRDSRRGAVTNGRFQLWIRRDCPPLEVRIRHRKLGLFEPFNMGTEYACCPSTRVIPI